jgi:hypothetical protein
MVEADHRVHWEGDVALFSAYFDESGTPDDPHRVLTVAGCVSSIEKWKRFEFAWSRLIQEAKLPDGTIFHMNRFARNLPPYENFKGEPKQKAALISSLVQCVKRHIHKAFSVTVILKDWERINRRYQFAVSLGYPYPFCGRICVAEVAKWAKKTGNSPVEFFFESGARDWGQLKTLLKVNDDIEAMDRSKDEMIQFQAADLLAWKNRKVMTEVVKYSGPPDRDVYDSINRSLAEIRSIPHKYGVHNYESMEALVEKARIPRRP